jgi:hypothetical protein
MATLSSAREETMKLQLLGAITAITLMGIGGAVSAHVSKTPQPSPEFSAKRTLVKKVRYTYQECMRESLTICTAQHPDDPLAKMQCVDARRDAICEGLPGTP